MEFKNKIIKNVDHIFITGDVQITLLATEPMSVTKPLVVYETLPEYVPSKYIQINLS